MWPSDSSNLCSYARTYESTDREGVTVSRATARRMVEASTVDAGLPAQPSSPNLASDTTPDRRGPLHNMGQAKWPARTTDAPPCPLCRSFFGIETDHERKGRRPQGTSAVVGRATGWRRFCLGGPQRYWRRPRLAPQRHLPHRGQSAQPREGPPSQLSISWALMRTTAFRTPGASLKDVSDAQVRGT